MSRLKRNLLVLIKIVFAEVKFRLSIRHLLVDDLDEALLVVQAEVFREDLL